MTITADTITDRVLHIVARVLDASPGDMTDDQTLHDDLAADSLDAVVIAMEIEGEFGIEVADEDGHLELETVADIADFVRRVATQQGVSLT